VTNNIYKHPFEKLFLGISFKTTYLTDGENLFPKAKMIIKQGSAAR
jgi:hypothetical protein